MSEERPKPFVSLPVSVDWTHFSSEGEMTARLVPVEKKPRDIRISDDIRLTLPADHPFARSLKPGDALTLTLGFQEV